MLKQKTLNSIAMTMLVLIISFMFAPIAFADDWGSLETTETQIEGSGTQISPISPIDSEQAAETTIEGRDALVGEISDAQSVYNAYIGTMPKVSTDDILMWATTKGNEVIYILQMLIQPFAVAIFMIGGFIALIGSIGRGDMVGKGVWAMVTSVLVYAAVLYAPVILQSFVGWVAA